MDSENWKNAIKEQTGTTAKKTTYGIIRIIFTNPIVITALIIFLILIILAVGLYAIKKEDFKTSANAANKYVDNTKIDSTNGITTTYVDEETGQEIEFTDEKLRELFEQYGYNVEQYFNTEDGMDKLKYILNAEIVTQFPYIEDLEIDKVNGVVRFKRISNEQNNEEVDDNFNNENVLEEDFLKFTSKEEFEKWINDYNTDNSMTELKQNALNHFYIDDEKNIIIAFVEEVVVSTNDTEKSIDNIKTNLDIKYQDIGYTTNYNETTGETIYTFQKLSTKKIDYSIFIKDYIMPTEFLLCLLTYSEDLQFVLDVAKLAYQSTIIIGINDTGMSSDVKEITYNKQIKVIESLATNGYAEFDLNNIFENTEGLLVSQSNNYFTILKEQVSENLFIDINNNEIMVEYIIDNNTGEEKPFIMDSNGSYIPANLKEYYLNYKINSYIPTVDLYVADVWYGYYNNVYTSMEENTEVVESNVSEQYPNQPYFNNDLSDNSLKDDEYHIEISKKIYDYLESDEYKQFIKQNFDAQFEIKCQNAFEDTVADSVDRDDYQTDEQYEQGRGEYIEEHYESFVSRYYELNYEHDFQAEFTKKVEDCKYSLQTNLAEKRYLRDSNIKQKSYIVNSSAYKAISIATENNYFSRILANSSKAYTLLNSTGEWFIDQLESNQETVGIADRVKYLLNDTYQTVQYGDISAEDIGLYITSSTSVNLRPSENFTEIAKACHDFLRLNNYYYSSAANVAAGNYVKDGTSIGGQVQIEENAPQNKRYTDCSAYVTWVLMQTGHFDFNLTAQKNSYWLYNNGDSVEGIIERKFNTKDEMINFFDIEANTKRLGYILVKQGHTEIYAGKDENGYYYTYNAGSTSSIRKEYSKYTKQQFFNHFKNTEYKVLIVE